MAIVGLLIGISYQESAKKLPFSETGGGQHLEAVIHLALVHGHVFTLGGILPLAMAGALVLARKTGGAEVPAWAQRTLTRGYLPFAAASLALQLYKGYHAPVARQRWRHRSGHRLRGLPRRFAPAAPGAVRHHHWDGRDPGRVPGRPPCSLRLRGAADGKETSGEEAQDHRPGGPRQPQAGPGRLGALERRHLCRHALVCTGTTGKLIEKAGRRDGRGERPAPPNRSPSCAPAPWAATSSWAP